MTKEVSEIKTNLDAMMITEEGSPVNADGTKLVFKMDEDSKSDKGSNEGLETIEYIKIGQNSNTLLNDDFALGGNYKVEQSSEMKYGQNSGGQYSFGGQGAYQQ